MSIESITKLSSLEQACKLLGIDPKVDRNEWDICKVLYRAACMILGKDRKFPFIFQDNAAPYAVAMRAEYILMTIRDAVVGDWVPNWDELSEYKYYPWFYMNKPGFRFNDSLYALTYSYSTGGSRLCFQSREQSDFVGKLCMPLYRNLMGAA